MATQKLPITDAGDEQLRDFCEIQGLDPSKANTRAKLLAVLEAAWDQPYILIQAPAPAIAGEEPPVQFNQRDPVTRLPGQIVGGKGLSDPEITVRLSNTEGPGGKQPVPVGVNGRTVVIQRGVDVLMPYRYYLALRDAIRHEIEPDPDPKNHNAPLDPVEVENYPCSVVRGPSQSEIDAWHARVDDVLMPQ